MVESGALLRDVYRTLFTGWGVTIPGGACSSVAAGGHFSGGGYGPLTRAFGYVADHLHAVEVVVVDADGAVRAVTATREADDPNRELWWAHTGGGGGNFGVVTRFWLRSDTAGTNPAELLPRPPTSVICTETIWPWAALTETSFARLLRNFGDWHEHNSDPDSPYTGLWGAMAAFQRSGPGIVLATQLDATRPDADDLLRAYQGAITSGLRTVHLRSRRTWPWLRATQWLGDTAENGVSGGRLKLKAAHLRTGLTDEQIATAYEHLTDPDYRNPKATLLLNGTGGRARSVSSGATAVAQRDSVLKAIFQICWDKPADDERQLRWLREFYRAVFARTGGVPVPDGHADGSYINYPDVDLADPAWNTSGVPWHTLYYKENYPRLQQVKARWDPLDMFRHALSVRPPVTAACGPPSHTRPAPNGSADPS
jgi:aclacinomycin oxidase